MLWTGEAGVGTAITEELNRRFDVERGAWVGWRLSFGGAGWVVAGAAVTGLCTSGVMDLDLLSLAARSSTPVVVVVMASTTGAAFSGSERWEAGGGEAVVLEEEEEEVVGLGGESWNSKSSWSGLCAGRTSSPFSPSSPKAKDDEKDGVVAGGCVAEEKDAEVANDEVPDSSDVAGWEGRECSGEEASEVTGE